MGNVWFGKKKSSKAVVHPVASHDRAGAAPEASTSVRIKVRMTRGQLRDYLAKMDVNEGTSELGSLIMKECLKGELHARVDANASEPTFKYAKGWSLSPIQEHSEEDHL